MYVIVNPSDSLRFMFGGMTRVSLFSKRTGTRHYYQVHEATKNHHIYYVQYIQGYNTKKQKKLYIGTIFDYNRFAITRKSQLDYGSEQVQAFSWVFTHLCAGTLPTHLVEVAHLGLCAGCGRHLTNPDSMQTGFGPTCYKRIKDKIKKI